MSGKHLAIDLGSSNGKMMLGEITGDRKLSMREIHRFPTPRVWFNGHIRIDIYRIYEEILDAIRRLGAEGVGLESLGADTWSSDYGIVSPGGEPVGLPVFYRDHRTLGVPERVERMVGYERLYPLTTQRRMRDSTLCQLLALMEESPHLLWGGNKILFLGDLLMQFFSGRVCSEITLASYSQLFSMEKMAWEDKAFALFGIPRDIAPEIIHPCECLGQIDRRLADRCGVNRFAVVAPAAHDTSSAVAAVPAEPGEAWAFISTGTWFLVGMELARPTNLPLCYQYDFSNTGLAFQKTMLKRNVTAMWLFQECRREWERMGIHTSHAELNRLAAGAKPFHALLDVDSPALFSPSDMPQAIVDSVQKTGQAPIDKRDVGQIARLIHEGIAFKCAYAIRCLEKITGQTLRVVYVVGGAGDIDVLNQMIASAANKEVVAGVSEAASTGNCLLQACGCGEVGSAEEIREIVKNSYPFKRFYPQNAAGWESHYEAYCQACGLAL